MDKFKLREAIREYDKQVKTLKEFDTYELLFPISAAKKVIEEARKVCTTIYKVTFTDHTFLMVKGLHSRQAAAIATEKYPRGQIKNIEIV